MGQITYQEYYCENCEKLFSFETSTNATKDESGYFYCSKKCFDEHYKLLESVKHPVCLYCGCRINGVHLKEAARCKDHIWFVDGQEMREGFCSPDCVQNYDNLGYSNLEGSVYTISNTEVYEVSYKNIPVGKYTCICCDYEFDWEDEDSDNVTLQMKNKQNDERLIFCSPKCFGSYVGSAIEARHAHCKICNRLFTQSELDEHINEINSFRGFYTSTGEYRLLSYDVYLPFSDPKHKYAFYRMSMCANCFEKKETLKKKSHEMIDDYTNKIYPKWKKTTLRRDRRRAFLEVQFFTLLVGVLNFYSIFSWSPITITWFGIILMVMFFVAKRGWFNRQDFIESVIAICIPVIVVILLLKYGLPFVLNKTGIALPKFEWKFLIPLLKVELAGFFSLKRTFYSSADLSGKSNIDFLVYCENHHCKNCRKDLHTIIEEDYDRYECIDNTCPSEDGYGQLHSF